MSSVTTAAPSASSAASKAAELPDSLQPFRIAALVVLVIAEALYLTVTFDTQHLDRVPSLWATLVGWSPEYLRVAITTLAVAMLVSGIQVWGVVRSAETPPHRTTFQYLALHLVILGAFISISGIVMGRDFATASHPGLWALAWAIAGGATVFSWAQSVTPLQVWAEALWRGRVGLLWGVAVGAAAWSGGFLTQALWKPLAQYTFSIVVWILTWFYTDLVIDPAGFVVGTRSFSVNIAPACSGYEGIGLILAFLGIALWLHRKDLKFPRALILLPLGAATIWCLNAVRIAVLVAIGSSGWPEVALGGFHSQAGWLTFNAVGLGFVALSLHVRYFTNSAFQDARAVRNGDSALADRTRLVSGGVPTTADPTTAYLAPFLAVVATAMVTGAFSAGFDWLYPARVVAAGAALWMFRKSYSELKWKWSWHAIGIGVVVFLLWLVLMPATAADQDHWPTALTRASGGWAGLWLMFRLVGSVITVPLAEELAFRGFLPRRLQQADFHRLPVATFALMPWAVSSILFGAMHGRLWVAGTLAGALFALALYRGRALGDAVQAHATTNALLALYACVTGRWSAWS